MKKVVVIGGGTGSFTVLRGLRKYHELDITAVVSMFDSGGSTGTLRDEFGILPPGDVRRCLVALAEERNIVRDLFNYRFDANCSLNGHSFGNLFLTALTQITGSEIEAIKKASKILKVKGKVLPVSIDNANLCAELENGELVFGEANIDIPKHNPKLRIKKVFLEPRARIYEETKNAIESADLIIIGPGDLYTSIIPNLLVEGVSEALCASRAKKAYVCNLMTKHGETTNFTASDHAKELLKYLGCGIYYIVCNNQHGSSELLKKYEAENAYPVKIDREELKKLGLALIEENLMTEPNLIRHDHNKLAKVLVNL